MQSPKQLPTDEIDLISYDLLGKLGKSYDHDIYSRLEQLMLEDDFEKICKNLLCDGYKEIDILGYIENEVSQVAANL
jgi:hypothetical protein